MPTFIFVSGFLMAYTAILIPDNKVPSLGSFAINKVKRLLIPYFTLSIVTFLPRVILNNFADDNFDLSFTQFVKSVFLPRDLIIPYFWFIQVSFILLIFSYSIFSIFRQRGFSRTSYILLMATLFMLLPFTELSGISVFSLNTALRYGIFFLSGIAYAVFMRNIDRVIPWSNIFTFMSFIIVWAIAFFVTENTGYEIICRFCGICMIISLSHILEDRQITFLNHLTGCNYIIFLLSWYFNVFSQQIMSKLIVLPWWIYTIMSLIAGVYGPYLFYVYLKNNSENKLVRGISFLLGQKLTRKVRI